MTRRKTDDTKKEAQEVGESLRAVMEEAGVSEGTVTCYVKDDTGDDLYLDRVGVDRLAGDVLHYLQKRWGGGRYHLLLKDGDGQYVKGGSLHFNVAGPPKWGDHGESDRLRELEERIQERTNDGKADPVVMMMFQTMREELRDLRSSSRSSGPDPLELMLKYQALGQERTDRLLELMLTTKKEDRDPMETVGALLGMAVQLKELGDSGGSGLDKVIGELATPLGRFFTSQADAADVSNKLAAGVGAAHPNPPEVPKLSPPKNPPAWYPLMQRFIPQLLKWARSGTDPELRAALVLEELPDRFLGPIHEQLKRGDEFAAEFLSAVPEAQDVREWFGVFFAAMLEGLDEMWVPDDEEGAAQEGAQEEEGAADTGLEEHDAEGSPAASVDQGDAD